MLTSLISTELLLAEMVCKMPLSLSTSSGTKDPDDSDGPHDVVDSDDHSYQGIDFEAETSI